MPGRAGIEAGLTLPDPPAPDTTRGSWQRPGPAVARAPALRVSQTSAGQVAPLVTACTDREPTDPPCASCHSAGVRAAEMSVQRSPAMPISRTGPGAAGRLAAATGAAVHSAAIAGPSPSSRAPATISILAARDFT